MKLGYAAPAMLLLLAGCFSYSSTKTGTPPPPIAAPGPVCVYGGQPYSPGARVVAPGGGLIECRPDGSWTRS
jgi:hypothetical protein